MTLEIICGILGGYALTLLAWIGLLKLVDYFFSQLEA